MIDALTLERAWKRLSSIADEADASVMRTAFSSIIRDSHDYSLALYDERGCLLAQPAFVTPGLLGGMAAAMQTLDSHIPYGNLKPGDVIVTNDPWIVSGHLPDVFVATPVFHNQRLVGFVACVFHHQDIGGRLGLDNREIYEEGLQIPPSLLHRNGVPNTDLINLIAANSRVPDLMLNDLRSQVTTVELAARRIGDFLTEFGWDSLVPIADAVFERTETAMRRAFEKIPDGTYRATYPVETGKPGETIMLKLALTIEGGRAVADFSGTDAQVARGINSVLNFTIAYVLFALKSVAAPFVPNNHGTAKPIEVKAPQGSILNVRRGAAVLGRNTVGHFIPELIFNALSEVVPERIIAESGSLPTWWLTLAGKRADGSNFVIGPMFSGGIGARANSDGVSCLTFPANINNSPVEMIEADSPIRVERREYLPDSGGLGRQRGGLGQEFVLHIPDDAALDGPVVESLSGGRFETEACGVAGGQAGSPASVFLNGKRLERGSPCLLSPGDRIAYRTAGGGGYGPPTERSREDVERDVRLGLVSKKAAQRDYGFT